VARLPAALRELAVLLGEEHDALARLQARAEKLLLQEAKQHQAVTLLASAPGIAAIRAAYIVGVVGTPERFRTKRQFWSYCGLAVVTRSSSDWEQNHNGGWIRRQRPQPRGLNHNRNALLKEVFKGAALTVITNMPNHPLTKNYHRLLEAGTKPPLARLTLARQLAAAVLAMWKNLQAYDPARHAVPKTA
jgi:hypothetical protein